MCRSLEYFFHKYFWDLNKSNLFFKLRISLPRKENIKMFWNSKSFLTCKYLHLSLKNVNVSAFSLSPRWVQRGNWEVCSVFKFWYIRHCYLNNKIWTLIKFCTKMCKNKIKNALSVNYPSWGNLKVY